MNRKAIFTSVLCTALFRHLYLYLFLAQKAYWASPDDSVAIKLIVMDRMWAEANCSPQPGLEEVFADDFMGTATDEHSIW